MYGLKYASKESILEKITPYDIFKYYINSFKDLGVAFKSELDKDEDPSCNIYAYNNNLYYKDFRDIRVYDCFDYVSKKYNLNNFETYDLINRDFNLKLLPNTSKTFDDLVKKEIILYGNDYPKEIVDKMLQVQVREWNNTSDKLFWYNQYGISVKDLKRFNVNPLKYLWSYNNLEWKQYILDPIAYGYYFGISKGIDRWKIYQPYSKYKWLSNTHNDTLQGYNQLKRESNTFILTKSLKDVIVIDKCGYESGASNAEGNTICMSIMSELNTTYSRKYILYDNDETGYKTANKFAKENNFIPIFLPENKAKDASDYVKKYGYDQLKEELKNLLNV